MKKNIFPIIGILAGVIMIIVGGVVIQEMDVGYHVNPEKFGADFYTYSHSATARAASNIRAVGQMLRSGFTALLMCLGLADICYFGCKLKGKEADKAPACPVSAVPTMEAPAENLDSQNTTMPTI